MQRKKLCKQWYIMVLIAIIQEVPETTHVEDNDPTYFSFPVFAYTIRYDSLINPRYFSDLAVRNFKKSLHGPIFGRDLK